MVSEQVGLPSDACALIGPFGRRIRNSIMEADGIISEFI